jgi:WD40 repeat protein
MGMSLAKREIPRSSEPVVSPDGQFTVVFTEIGMASDQTIRARLKRTADGAFIASLGKAQYALFSEDSSFIVTVSLDDKASLYNTQGHLLRRFKAPAEVYNVEFKSENGALALVLNDDISWAVRGFGIKTLADHQAPVLRIAIAENAGQPLLLASTQSDIARLWDVHTGQLLAEVQHELLEGAFNTTFARFSPDGTYFVTWSDMTAEDGYPKMIVQAGKAYVHRWDLQGKLLNSLEHPGMLMDVIISPDSSQILTFPAYSGYKIWTKEGKEIRHHQHDAYPLSATFISDRQDFLTSRGIGARSVGELWDLRGNLQRTFDGRTYPSTPITDPFNPHNLTQPSEAMCYVAYPAFSPDGRFFLSFNLGFSPFISVWNFERGEVLYVFSHWEKVFSAVFSPVDNELILSASADGTAKLWSLEGKLLQSFGHDGPVYSARFSPDGQYVLTASADGTAKLWDLDGHLLADLNKHMGEVYSAIFTPDGGSMCTASEDGTVRLWPTPHAIKAWMDERDGVRESGADVGTR